MTHAFNHSRWEQERKARMGRVAGWRTINSAPEKTPVLVVKDGIMGVRERFGDSWQEPSIYAHDWDDDLEEPTHWMPLPPQP